MTTGIERDYWGYDLNTGPDGRQPATLDVLTDDTAGTYFPPKSIPQSAVVIGPPGVIEHIGDPDPSTKAGAPSYTVPFGSNLTTTAAWTTTGLSNITGRGNYYVFTTTGRVRVVFQGQWGNVSGANQAYLSIRPLPNGTADINFFNEDCQDGDRYHEPMLTTGQYYPFLHEQIFTVGTEHLNTRIQWGVAYFITANNLYINTESANGKFYFQFFPDDGVSQGWERIG